MKNISCINLSEEKTHNWNILRGLSNETMRVLSFVAA